MTPCRKLIGVVCVVATLLATVAAQRAEDAPQGKRAASEAPAPRQLVRVQAVEAPAEVATEFAPPLRCDKDGNLYLEGETFGVSGLRKLSPKGERLATYNPNPDSSVKPDFSGTFALDGDGSLYALVFAQDTITRYVFVYRADGSYRSTIKLDPGFAWNPTALAVFSTGDLLITGTKYARDQEQKLVSVPFTGLFHSDGKLLQEVALEDDRSLQELADSGDKRLASPRAPGTNLAISFSRTDVGEDGNLYLMRWMSPAIIYAIAPTGEVVRRFTVDPGDANAHPVAMHLSGNRMAVLFLQPETWERTMKVVDLEGHEIATYKQTTKAADATVGAAFVCYTADPQRFTFLGATSESRLQLIIAEGR